MRESTGAARVGRRTGEMDLHLERVENGTKCNEMIAGA